MKTRAAVLRRSPVERPYAHTKPLSIEMVDLDPPGPDELLVRIGAAGLCHSDLSVINGDRPRPLPMVLGHEAAGTVEAVGRGVRDLVPGDRVVRSFMPSCVIVVPARKAGPRFAFRARKRTARARFFRARGGCIAKRSRSIIISAFPALPTMSWSRVIPP